jgi:hypothetical protein
MGDDAKQYDADRRLREILMPPSAAVDRVVAGALARRQARRPLRRWRWVAVATVAVLIAAMVTWQRAVGRNSTVPVIRVSRDVSMIVVQSSDGGRWLLTPPAARRSGGHYVIVVPE